MNMDAREPKFCPTCEASSTRNRLILRQINLDCAVYLCEDKMCAYPEGFSWITVQRSLDEMYRENKKLKKHRKCRTDVVPNKIYREPVTDDTSEADHSVLDIDTSFIIEPSFNIDCLIEEEIDKLNSCPQDTIDLFDLDAVLFEDEGLVADSSVSELLDSVLLAEENAIGSNCNDDNGSNTSGLVKKLVYNSCTKNNNDNEKSEETKAVILDQYIFGDF